MMARTLESPRPVPWGFVVKSGSNIFCMLSSDMPVPESSNSKTRWVFSCMARMTMLPAPVPMASTALDKILLKATANCMRSAIKEQSFAGNVIAICFGILMFFMASSRIVAMETSVISSGRVLTNPMTWLI
jgi:hypothetical protein